MSKKPGVLIYHDVLPALEKMKRSDVGDLFISALRYSKFGEYPSLAGASSLVWEILREAIDRNDERYEDQRLKGAWGAYKKEQLAKSKSFLPFNEWLIQRNSASTLEGTKGYSGTHEDALETYQNVTERSEANRNETERNNISSCAELQGSSTPQEPPEILLPLNDGSDYGVTQANVTEWEELYPAVDVMQQLRQMRGWLLANPTNKKTKKEFFAL